MKTTHNRGIYFLVLAATLFFVSSCAPVGHKSTKIVHKMEKIEVKKSKLDVKYKDLQQQQKQSISSNNRR